MASVIKYIALLLIFSCLIYLFFLTFVSLGLLLYEVLSLQSLPQALLYRDLDKTRSDSRKQDFKIILPTYLETVRLIAGSKMLYIVITEVLTYGYWCSAVEDQEALGDQEVVSLTLYGSKVF